MSSTDVEHVLVDLYRRVQQRRKSGPPGSYVAGLFRQGEDAVLQKIGEEAVETILAAKRGAVDEIVHETADLWFHCLVMMAMHGVSPEQVLAALVRRFK